jgi:hypothetical protein
MPEFELGTSALMTFWAATFRVRNNTGNKGRNDKEERKIEKGKQI